METIKTNEIIFREDLYPRIKHDPALVQRYAENLEQLPPIEINQNKELIDGFHRWTAHKKNDVEDIRVMVTPTKNESELLGLAIDRNAKHGYQLTPEDKRKIARQLYQNKSHDRAQLQKLLSVSAGSLSNWLSDIDRAQREEQERRIVNLWLACYTSEEIATSENLTDSAIRKQIPALTGKLSGMKNFTKAQYIDEDFETPIYNIWTFTKKSNSVSHFGNSEQRIVDNLLYLYTNPFDIVVDPFAGGGATIDVCRKRLRRYFVSDRKPIVERENEIRQMDICAELPQFHNRWSDVRLVYLDPPYWKQAFEKYSKDKEDLANMPLEMFTEKTAGIVKRFADKMSNGHIAMLMQPTQWNAENRQYTDHIFDIIKAVGNKTLVLENRVSCPYSTEQANPQMVDYAKENKKLLVLSRELIIWRINKG